MKPLSSSVLLGASTLEMHLRQYATSEVVLRFAHQPNLFASGYVLSTAALAENIARRTVKSGAVVKVDYVVIDYDAADDERTFRAPIARIAPVPGINYRRVITRRHAKERIACSIDSSEIASNLATLYRCILEASLSLRHSLAMIGFPVASRSHCRSVVRRSFDVLDALLISNPRLSDATALHNTWVLQEAFSCRPVQVTKGYQWLASHSEERLSLTSELLRASPELSQRLIWAICENCFRRMRVRTSIVEGDVITERRKCRSCDACSEEALLRFHCTIDSSAGPCPSFVPSVYLDDIMDRYVGDHSASVYYPGSYLHAQEATRILERAESAGMQTSRLPTPDWCPTMSELAWIWDSKITDAKFCGLLGRISACMAWSLTPGSFAENFEDRVNALQRRRAESPQGEFITPASVITRAVDITTQDI